VRLFQNLLSNAIKYTEDSTSPQITINAAENGSSKTEITIKDNGIGFDQTDAEKIFEPFQRLHGRNSKYEGTGIGLASCRKIVEQHQGNIRAESTPSEGTTFFITLPVNNDQVAA